MRSVDEKFPSNAPPLRCELSKKRSSANDVAAMLSELKNLSDEVLKEADEILLPVMSYQDQSARQEPYDERNNTTVEIAMPPLFDTYRDLIVVIRKNLLAIKEDLYRTEL